MVESVKNSKFHPSFEYFDIWLNKHISNEDLNRNLDIENLKSTMKISTFIEFSNFNTRTSFIQLLNKNKPENIELLKEFSKLPIIWVEAPYNWIEKVSQNESILKVHGNHQIYLCMDSVNISSDIEDLHKSFYEITGKGITVGLIDSGIDQNHPDLSNKVIEVINFLDEKDGDFNGHGTFMAGIIAGSGKSSKNICRGIAPDANIVDIKVFNREGTATIAEIIIAIDLLLEKFSEKTPDIIVFGCSTGSVYRNDDLISKYCHLLVQHNIAIVAPTGNFGPDIDIVGSPGGSSDVLSVGGVGVVGGVNKYQIPFFSGRGSSLDIVLPATDIIAAKASENFIGIPLNDIPNYIKLSGTSASAAIAAGMLALIKQSLPNSTPRQLYEIIKSRTVQLSINEVSQGKGIPKLKEIFKMEHLYIPKPLPFSKALLFSSLFSVSILILFIALFYMF